MESRLEQEITLKEFIQKSSVWVSYLKARWLIIIAGGLIGAGIGFAVAYYDKPIYTATLSFALEEDKGGSMGGAMGLASQLGLDLGGGAGGAFSSANLQELMKSRTLVEKALMNAVTINGRTISLAEHYIEFSGWRDAWSKDPVANAVHFPPNADRKNFTIVQDSVLGVIYKNLLSANLAVGQKDKKSSINVIDVKSPNELFSKAFAENLASEVSDFYVETKTKKSLQNVSILKRQVDSVRGELNAALTGVAVLNDYVFGLNPAMTAKRVSPTKRQIDVQANTAILTQLVQNLELSKMSLMRETPLIQVIDRPILPLKKEKQSKRNGLIYGGFMGALIIIFILLLIAIWKRVRMQPQAANLN